MAAPTLKGDGAGPSQKPLPVDPSTSDADALWASAGWDSTPLFMRSLPPTSDHSSSTDNNAIEALQALVYESTPEETVRSLRERGNELFRMKKYKEARGFYDQAVTEVIERKVQEREDGGRDGEVKDETKRAVYANRAACQYELYNYASCLRDCVLALSPPLPSPAPTAVRRALFRSAKASLALDKHSDALDALDRLKALDTKEGRSDGADAKDVEDLRRRIREGLERAEKRRRQEEDRKELDASWGKALRTAFEARGLLLPPGITLPIPSSSIPPNVIPATFDHPFRSPGLNPPPDPVDTSLQYPVYVLRPLAEPPTRDLVLAWHEDAVVGDHLLAMSPPSSSGPAMSLYITTKFGRVLKVGKALTLKKVLAAARDKEKGDGVELLEGWCLEVLWLPDGEEGKRWIEGWKREHATRR